eukprot:4713029-Prymnesium_polylepis.1
MPSTLRLVANTWQGGTPLGPYSAFASPSHQLDTKDIPGHLPVSHGAPAKATAGHSGGSAASGYRRCC